MAFSVKFSQQAADDLSNIVNYLVNDLYSPKAAERLYNAVSKQIVILTENPRIHPLHHDERLSMQGLRFATIGKYLLFYTLDDAACIIQIVRILYSKRDLASAFDS